MNKTAITLWKAAPILIPLLIATTSPTLAAGWAPITGFATWYFAIVGIVAGILLSVVGWQIVVQHHDIMQMMGTVSSKAVGLGIAVLAAPLLAAWGIGGAAGAMLHHVLR